MNDEQRAPVHRSSFSVHRSDDDYDAFAYAYDRALGERFFRAAKPLLIGVLEKHDVGRTHLDIACGTGLAMKFFEGRGFRSTGVDLSLPMLEAARRRTSRLIAADMRALPLRSRFGIVTCLYDALNHLDELGPAFEAIRACLESRSLFVFDMNNPAIYPEIWGMAEPYIAEGEDFHLEIATKFDARSAIGDALVRGWAMFGGRRVSIEEHHQQRAHPRGAIESALKSAGLQPVEVIDFDPFSEARRVKLFYVCRTLS